MKKIFSLITLSTLMFGVITPLFNIVNAELTTKKVRVVVTYPISDVWLWVDAGWLVHEPNSWIVFRFALKDSGWINLCMEEKSVAVVNWIITYNLGSQYAINANWISTWCNMSALINNSTYKIEVTWDLNKDNDFTDPIDYTSEEAVWTQSSSQQFEDSFLDSKTLEMQNNIVSWDWWSTANIDYNVSAWLLNTQLISSWNKTKTFDLDWDWNAEVFAVPQWGWDGVIYSVNKLTWSLENILTSWNITIDDNTNIFLVWRLWNFVLNWLLWTNSAITVSDISWISITYQNWTVVETSQDIKEFVATDYIIINLWWKDTTFKFNPLSRIYEEQVSIPLWSSSSLYNSVTSVDWSWTPFSSDSVDYYWWDIREAIVNGTTFTDVDWVVYWDFNQDNRLDFISYKNSDWWMAYFTVHMRKADWTYKSILTDVLADWVNAWTSLVDNSVDFWWTDINEIIFTVDDLKTIYKINWNWENAIVWDWPTNTVTTIASFDSTYYAVISNTWWTTNINETFFTIWDGFRDMNDLNVNDKFLLIVNYKVKKDWYDYYDYTIKKYNWTVFIDLMNEDGITPFKWTWNKLGITKIASSDFYAFYVDKSTNYSKSKQDKADLFFVHTNKVIPIMKDIVINPNNTLITEDWIWNEWWSKLLLNSSFWLYWFNLNNESSWFLWIDNINYVSANINWFIQYIWDSRNYIAFTDSWILKTEIVKDNLNSVFTRLTINDWIVLSLDTLVSTFWYTKIQFYDKLKSLSWWIGSPRVSIWWGRWLISDYINSSDFNSQIWLNIFYKSESEIWVLNSSLLSESISDYWTNIHAHTIQSLKNRAYWPLVNWYIYLDNSNNKYIYIDNWWIWFNDLNQISPYGGSYIPYLDSWNYLWTWIRLVWWDNSWYWNSVSLQTIPGLINRTNNTQGCWYAIWDLSHWWPLVPYVLVTWYNYMNSSTRCTVDKFWNISTSSWNSNWIYEHYYYSFYPLY